MSSGKHQNKKGEQKSKPETTAVRKSDAKEHLEAVLNAPTMKTLESYTDEEIMDLYERSKLLHDIVKTRMLLLPRDLRIPTQHAAYMKEILEQLAQEKNGVVEGDDEDEEVDEEDEDAEDDEILESDSDSETEDPEQIRHYMKLIKTRLVLTDLMEQEETADDDELAYEDDMDIDEGDDDDDDDSALMDLAADDSEDEIVTKKSSSNKKKNKKGPIIEELEEESEEDESTLLGEMEEDEEDGEEDEDYDSLTMTRSFLAVFSLLDSEGKVAVENLVLESSDKYAGETEFEGVHHLTWNDETIFSLNVQDSELVDPDMPSLDELQDEFENADELDSELLSSGLPNDWNEEAAEAIKEAADFPKDLTGTQFIVLMTRVMSRLVKNGARKPGPAPADGILPTLALELANAAEEEAAEGEDDEESEEEVVVAAPVSTKKAAAPTTTHNNDKKKKSQNASPAASPSAPQQGNKKHSQGQKSPSPAPQHVNKKHDGKKSAPPAHTAASPQHGNKHQHNDKKHNHGGQKSPSPHKQHGNNNNHNNNNNKHQHNDKKRAHPHGDREGGFNKKSKR